MFKECVGWCSVRKQYIRMVFVMCSLCVRKGKKNTEKLLSYRFLRSRKRG